ncbi:hypothetical protein BCS94_09215 [Vibrio breoganii]|nr:hypothetical protein BCS94_09215 [Vibrio breoganii]
MAIRTNNAEKYRHSGGLLAGILGSAQLRIVLYKFPPDQLNLSNALSKILDSDAVASRMTFFDYLCFKLTLLSKINLIQSRWPIRALGHDVISYVFPGCR